MSFDRMVKQDLFRSGGGAHRVFLKTMIKKSSLWRRTWYRVSIYHRVLEAIEKRQISPEGSRKIVAVCKRGKREMVDAYGLPEDKVVVIHNGVDHERFNPRRRLEGGRGIRKKLGIPFDRPVVIFVGTGFRRKGLDRLLHLWHSRKLKGVYLLVVGNDARLSYYRNRWNRREVLFVGPQPAVEDYYGAADLLVLPSVQESFGNVVLEALASGLPVVTIPGVGAAEEIEGDLKEGIIVDPDDLEELEKRIRTLLDPVPWPRLSQEARRVAEKYSWQRYLDEVEKCLFGICQQRGSGRGALQSSGVMMSPPV
jgi:UDP-glucose:(heptosyl)LPS alpha-1,3-glucosyltransferase